LEYDGTRYHGSQYQSNALTIQGEIEDAVHRLTGEESRVSMASRTDAGVHAKGQVASFKTTMALSPENWVKALNFCLAKDISASVSYEADFDFDVRRDAICREYRYCIMNRPAPSALWRNFCEFVHWPLDIDVMNEACECLVGEHDFAPFSSVFDDRRTVRRVSSAEVTRKGDLVMFNMSADSFLPHQVRNTVGGLIKVGLGKLKGETFCEMASSGRAGIIGPAASARGLCLMGVRYSDFPPA
jgi:tRNA pseudouridine38-40 synthase